MDSARRILENGPADGNAFIARFMMIEEVRRLHGEIEARDDEITRLSLGDPDA